MRETYKYPAWESDPYGNCHNKEIVALRDACRSDLKFLCKEVLGMTKWDDDLHNDLAAYLEKSGKHKLVLIPRGHLKSSIVTIGWTIQQLLRNPNLRILIRNAVWDQARRFLWQIQGYLESGQLPVIFGKFASKNTVWTKDEIEIAARKERKASPSIMTAGLETSLTGLHFDILVDDDLVNDKNTSTKEQIQKVIDVYNDSFNLLDRGGTHVVIGTRWNQKDLYGHILSSDTGTVNGVPVDPEEGGQAWRTTYQKWTKMKSA